MSLQCNSASVVNNISYIKYYYTILDIMDKYNYRIKDIYIIKVINYSEFGELHINS